MALKIFENLFKKESSKKNEAEIVKDEIEDIQVNFEEKEDNFEEDDSKNNTLDTDEELQYLENIEEIKNITEAEEDIVEYEEVKNFENSNKENESLVIEKKGLFARLKEGLKKTSDSFTEKFDNLFKGYLKIDDDLYEELEEILITSDISFDTTLKIVENLKRNIKRKNINDVNMVKSELKEVLYELLENNDSKLNMDNQKNNYWEIGFKI